MPPIGEDDDLIETPDAVDQEDPNNQDAAPEGEGADTQPGDDADELEIRFEGEDEPAEGDEPDLIKRLRAEVREARREAAEARRAIPVTAPPKIEVGPKPTMEGCDFDEAKFETELDAWKERKAKADAAETEATQFEAKKREAFQVDLERFSKHRADLKAPDFDHAEAVVASVLTKEQASALLQATDNSAKVIYALGKRPERLKALAGETNIVKFIASVAKLEGSVKVSNSRRSAPEPDVPPRGSARLSPTVDRKLEALEKEADRTGDRSKVQAYKREQRAKPAK